MSRGQRGPLRNATQSVVRRLGKVMRRQAHERWAKCLPRTSYILLLLGAMCWSTSFAQTVILGTNQIQGIETAIMLGKRRRSKPQP
jgi:hypothetical protein